MGTVVQVTIEWPYVFAQSLIYGVIVYAMIQFEWSAAKFFYFIFFMYLTLLYFTYWGMVTVAITPNAQFAAIISSAFYGLWNLFSGFLIPRPVRILPPDNSRTPRTSTTPSFSSRSTEIGDLSRKMNIKLA